MKTVLYVLAAPICRYLQLCALLPFLAACASQPNHPSYFTQNAGVDCLPALQATSDGPQPNQDGGYYLHVIEFDDQGWAFPEKTREDVPPPSPTYRIDCAIRHLRATIESARPALTFVYVHGWHHTAADSDDDLLKFKETLREQYRRHGQERRVIGYYIGWNGESIDIPLLRQTTFWGRKNAAHHVAEGSVREFFARLKALREYWNRPSNAESIGMHDCRRGDDGQGVRLRGPECPIRTVMMGHSFGAWILFASTSPYILETLASASDVPLNPKAKQTERERGIADLVVLINPAFEASRYDAIFNAARRYNSERYELPLLVTITSDNDNATGTLFPVARAANSAFQYPATSDLESRAMKRTHGHMTEYLTHELRFEGQWSNADERYDPCRTADESAALRKEFVERLKASYPRPAPGRLQRQFCGGLALTWSGGPLSTPDSIVWNIRTHASVIDGHNGIHRRPFEYFLEQMYEDLSDIPRFTWTGREIGRGAP